VVAALLVVVWPARYPMGSLVPSTSGRRDTSLLRIHFMYVVQGLPLPPERGTCPLTSVCSLRQPAHTVVPNNQPLAIDAVSRPTSQDNSSLLWSCNVHRHVHKIVPLVNTLTTTIRFKHAFLFLKNIIDCHYPSKT
jgi:hypothetical protein